jgi:hypothetical protein
MPVIQTSLAMAVPAAVGRMPSASVIPGVLRYICSVPAPKAVSAAPATSGETKGASSSAPSAISPPDSRLPNCCGGSLAAEGMAADAMPCRPAALSASRPRLPMPLLRMKAPVARRRGRWLSRMSVRYPGAPTRNPTRRLAA